MSNESKKTAASMLRKGALKAEELIDQDKFKKSLEHLQANTPLGQGAQTIKDEFVALKISLELRKRLLALPNAFDFVTGKLNRENDQAMFLWESIKAHELYMQYPLLWEYKK